MSRPGDAAAGLRLQPAGTEGATARGGPLQPLVEELERTALSLRADELEADAAAELVERCAEAANRLGAELDRLARARPEAGGTGQGALL